MGNAVRHGTRQGRPPAVAGDRFATLDPHHTEPEVGSYRGDAEVRAVSSRAQRASPDVKGHSAQATSSRAQRHLTIRAGVGFGSHKGLQNLDQEAVSMGPR